MVLVAQQKMRHRRHQRVGQNVGGDHREDDRHRQRSEQIAGDPAERQQRHESDADAKQRDRRRRHDFLRAAGDGGQDVFAVLLHVTIDVLDGDRRVVDQNADRERQTAERHHVDGLAEQRQRDQRAQHRQRYRNGDDEGRAPTAEKDEDHEAGQRGRDQSFANDGSDGGFDEARLVADEVEIDAGRERRLNGRKPLLYGGDDVEGRGGADLQHRHQHALAAIRLHDVGLRRRTVVDVGDIAHEDDHAVDHFDRQIIEIFDGFWRIVEVDRVFVGTDLFGADRRDQVLPREGAADVGRREAVGAQRILVEVDLHLAGGTAVGVWQLDARDRRERGRMKFGARSLSSVCESVSLDNASWMIGTLEAS